MFRISKLLRIILLSLMLSLIGGCSDGSVPQPDDESNPFRTFVFSDSYPYPGKKADLSIDDQQVGVSHTIYVYVVNNGENWKANDLRNIVITYYDLTHSETIEILPEQIHILESEDKGLTYIRVDNIVYPEDASGYFFIEGDIYQGNGWVHREVSCEQFDYGDPPEIIPPSLRTNILYEKEIVN